MIEKCSGSPNSSSSAAPSLTGPSSNSKRTGNSSLLPPDTSIASATPIMDGLSLATLDLWDDKITEKDRHTLRDVLAETFEGSMKQAWRTLNEPSKASQVTAAWKPIVLDGKHAQSVRRMVDAYWSLHLEKGSTRSGAFGKETSASETPSLSKAESQVMEQLIRKTAAMLPWPIWKAAYNNALHNCRVVLDAVQTIAAIGEAQSEAREKLLDRLRGLEEARDQLDDGKLRAHRSYVDTDLQELWLLWGKMMAAHPALFPDGPHLPTTLEHFKGLIEVAEDGSVTVLRPKAA